LFFFVFSYPFSLFNIYPNLYLEIPISLNLWHNASRVIIKCLLIFKKNIILFKNKLKNWMTFNVIIS
jgi:hypothetical protein